MAMEKTIDFGPLRPLMEQAAEFNERIIAAAAAQAFPNLLWSIHRNMVGLFADASDEQKAAFVALLEAATASSEKMFAHGATKAEVLQFWREKYQEALHMPRLAPPPPTPQSEVDRFAAAMTNVRLRCRFQGIELDSLVEVLRRGEPGEQIITFTESSITTTAREIRRRDLVRILCPGSMTRFDRWDGQFPRAENYERDEPRPEPVQVVRE